MSAIVCVLCFSSLLSIGSALFDSVHPPRLEPPAIFLNVTDEAKLIINGTDPGSTHSPPKLFPPGVTSFDIKAPILFPKKSDESTPILNGNDPHAAHLPPKYFPSRSLDHSTEVSTASINTTATTGEADDMLHAKYTGGLDVDEKLKPQKKVAEKEKKATEKDEEKPSTPKSEVVVSTSLDKNGPKQMNSSSGTSIFESTSKVMAESSRVLSKQTTQERHHATLGPARTVASVLLSAVAVLCLAVIGIMVWKRITMRKFGRDILINEEDFDDTSDLHTFDRAQIQIT